MNDERAVALWRRGPRARLGILAAAVAISLVAGHDTRGQGRLGIETRFHLNENPKPITRPSEPAGASGGVGEATRSLVLAMAVSPDGRMLALAGEDPAIALRDTATNGTIGSLSGHTEPVACLAFSPDGTVLASGGYDRTIRFWDVSTRAERTACPEQPGRVLALAFAPDGKTLASGGQDGAISLWDLEGRKVATLSGHNGPIRSLAFSPDGKALVSGGDDRRVRLWDARTREAKSSWEGHQGAIRALAYSPDGETLATASEDHTVRLWDVANGRQRAVHGEGTDMLLAVAFSPLGNGLVAGGYDGKLRIWSPPERPDGAVLRGHAEGVTALAFNPRTEALATAGYDQSVKLWEPGARVATLRKALPSSTTGNTEGLVEFSPDGRSLLTAQLSSQAAAGAVRVWDSSTWLERGAVRQDDGLHVFGQFAAGGRLVLTASPGAIALWDARRLTPVASLVSRASRAQRFLTYAVSRDETLLAYVDEQNAVVVRDLPSQSELAAAVPGAWIEPRRMQIVARAETGLVVNQLNFAPDGKTIAVVQADFRDRHATFTLHDVADGRELVRKPVRGREFGRVFFAPDQKTAVGVFLNQATETDTSLVFWSTSTWADVAQMTIPPSAPTAFAYSPDGSYFGTATRKGMVSFWDARSRAPLGQFTAHDGVIVSLAFSADGRRLATASTTAGEPVRIWDLDASLAQRRRRTP